MALLFSIYDKSDLEDMVRNYKRKTQRQSWTEDIMSMAIEAVVTGKKGVKTAAHLFNVPPTTLERRILRYKNNPGMGTILSKGMGHWKRIFTNEQEDELVMYVKRMEERLFGVTAKEIRQLAFQYAEKNKLHHPFNKEIGIAGADWLVGFLKRHPDVSTCRPDAAAAAKAMRTDEVAEFFKFGLAYSEAARIPEATEKFEKIEMWQEDENISVEPDFMTVDTTNVKIERSAFDSKEMQPGPSMLRTTLTNDGDESSSVESSSVAAHSRSLVDSACLAIPKTSNGSTEDISQLPPTFSGIETKPFYQSPEENFSTSPETSFSRSKSTPQCDKATVLSCSLYDTEPSEENDIVYPNVTISESPETNECKRPKTEKRREGRGGWIQCTECKGWAHRVCAGVDSEGEVLHNCKFSTRKCTPRLPLVQG